MTKGWAIAVGAVFLLGGASVASASCVSDAAAVRAECIGGSHDRAMIASCSADYRDDVRECHRYGGEPDAMPMHKPMMHKPMMHHVPPPPPHHP